MLKSVVLGGKKELLTKRLAERRMETELARISLLLSSGAAPQVAQKQLRHSDARITLGIYGHIIGDSHREAVDKVASILFPTVPNLKPATEVIQ